MLLIIFGITTLSLTVWSFWISLSDCGKSDVLAFLENWELFSALGLSWLCFYVTIPDGIKEKKDNA